LTGFQVMPLVDSLGKSITERPCRSGRPQTQPAKGGSPETTDRGVHGPRLFGLVTGHGLNVRVRYPSADPSWWEKENPGPRAGALLSVVSSLDQGVVADQAVVVPLSATDTLPVKVLAKPTAVSNSASVADAPLWVYETAVLPVIPVPAGLSAV